jgi:DNA polymerase-1
VSLLRKIFRQIVVLDFEYEVANGVYNLREGDLPVPLCMVAHILDENLRHVRTIKMWREELFACHLPPFDIGDDTLIVGYSLWAELTCFLVLGWPFPKHVFDLHTAYLAASNILLPYDPDEKRIKQGKGLADACRAYGISGWENLDKKEIAKDIGEGRWQKYGTDVVFYYCETDVSKSGDLLRAQLRGRFDSCGRVIYPPADVDRILHWSNYSAKAVALIQARGMPIDTHTWGLMQENEAAVLAELLRQFDPSQGDDDPIYSREGEFSYRRFESWLARIGVTAWPRLESGALDLEGDAFRLMTHVPGIEGLHMLRDSLRVIISAKLPIGRDARNRPSLFPFGTVTGRNAHRRSLYNAHAGLRSLMVFQTDHIGAYLDYRTQEVGIGAAGSGDEALKRAYNGGDVYHALARMCGLTSEDNIETWKKAFPDVRHRMKGLQLGITYGMGVPSLARGLDRHPLIASEIIERHKRTYPRFWEWRAGMVQGAMLSRRIESAFGWRLRLSTNPNQRTLYNFPMQSGGAEMLRLAAWRLCEAGIVPIMLVHDGILFEETDPEKIAHAQEIMRGAGRDVCGGFEIGVDIDQMLGGGARYRDKRPMAQKMWQKIEDTLDVVIPKRRRG